MQVDSLPAELQGIANPISSGSSWPMNRTGVSCIAGRSFTNWAMREESKGLIADTDVIFFFKFQDN